MLTAGSSPPCQAICLQSSLLSKPLYLPIPSFPPQWVSPTVDGSEIHGHQATLVNPKLQPSTLVIVETGTQFWILSTEQGSGCVDINWC